MTTQEQYDAKIQAAQTERDFRIREILYAEAERLRKELSRNDSQD